MEYEIKGAPFPVVECTLGPNESMLSDSGAMAWMDSCLEMETTSNGGISKAFGRMFSGETMFLNRYTSSAIGKIAFSSSFPGEILAIDLSGGKEIVVQKSSFLCSEETVERKTFFAKSFSTGIFGGEGFVMSKYYGEGIMFVEIDGSVEVKELSPGQKITIDSGYLAMMDATCKMEVKTVSGLKNKMLGGEGFFNTVITGPGRIWLQTMPISAIAQTLTRYIPGK